MNNVLTLENFISGEVFANGINNTILKEPGVETERTFLVLFDSNTSSILASSKALEGAEIVFNKSENDSGGTLIINSIKEEDTKTYVPEGSFIADGFALIRTVGASEQTSAGTNVIFPINFENYKIFIKGKLSNTPTISSSSKFTFNKTEIKFGV